MYDDGASLTDHSTQYGMRLCNAVKSQRCLYDPQSVGYRVKGTNTASWKVVAKECNDTVANCRFRWKTIRNSFTRSYKKFGDKSDYYLYAHLIFLIPYLGANHDKNDDSISEYGNKSLVDTETNNNGYSDSETTKSAEETQKDIQVLQNISNDIIYDTQQEDQNESLIQKTTDYRKVEFEKNVIDLIDDKEQEANDRQQDDHHNEVQCQKTTDNHNEKCEDKAVVPENETTDSQHSDEKSDENVGGRRLRDRKTPKRFMDMDFSPERSAEKRPRRIMQRRKSVGGLVLKEFALRNSLPDFPFTNENFIRPKPKLTAEIPSYCDTTVDDRNLFKQNDNGNFKIYSQDASAMAKPIMVDSFTITELHAETVSVATQCEAGPRNPDDEFLDTIKPQMEIMNLRQKVNFKRRVYQALMEVLDDGKNFPNENEIFEAACAVSADFKASTSSELRLMRELVSIVQAAKTTPELGTIGSIITPVVEAAKPPVVCSPTTTTVISTPPIRPSQTVEKQVTPPIIDCTLSPNRNIQHQMNSPNAGKSTTISAAANPLGIPRHVIQKAVKVAGNNGSTIMTHDGDKRRVYRIYPKHPSGSPQPANPPAAHNATPPSTFFVTPPNPVNKPPSNPPPNQSNSSPSNFKVVPFAPPAANRVANKTTSNAMLPPSSNRPPAATNGVNKPNTSTPPSNNGVSSQVHGKIIQRRYSICGPAPARNQPISAQNRVAKPYTRTGATQLPPLQRIQQLPQQQEFRQHLANQNIIRQAQRPSPPQNLAGPGAIQSNISKIQLSKPVSLNTAVNNNNQSKPFKLIPAINDNCRPRIVEPLQLLEPLPMALQPEPVSEHRNTIESLSLSESSILEMAGTIAADNFGSFFNKPIKDEPED